ncbi:hypothetical protein CERSUDRAFT_85732 [Gelatoporia subvermispora B]|uniref:Uncharacterized protein n=1 Tax=Ceriporiopsis subvermispora (strain B) TaxID=914234 RepID=M2QSG7_CERS8|nr:hypothetical protein CERSUDRAFT_85732 [Gelatoporia subvermispora B]
MRMAALSDLDRFFCEQQRRADLPNEEFDEYLFRMSKLRRSHQGDCDAVIRSSFREYSKDDAAKFGGIPAGVPGPSTHQDDLSGITAFPEIRALVNISMTKRYT